MYREADGMNPRSGLWPGLWIVVLSLAGCYEEPKATFFEPGEYQGRTDPLLERQADPAQQQQLLERLRLVQMDR